MNITSTALNLESGFPMTVPNTTNISSGSITASYVISGSPSSMSIFVEGQNSNGTVVVLDTYNYSAGDTTITRSISISAVYSNFKITPTRTGSGISVTGSLSAQGNGPSFTSSSLSSVGTWSQG